jgi:hypothetical protein
MSEVTIQISQEIADKIMADVRGDGGFQNLLRKLRKQVDAQALLLTLDPTDIEAIPRYYSYEPGGFEDRLLPLLDLLRTRGLIPGEDG